jgi:hypothetical protein
MKKIVNKLYNKGVVATTVFVGGLVSTSVLGGGLATEFGIIIGTLLLINFIMMFID